MKKLKDYFDFKNKSKTNKIRIILGMCLTIIALITNVYWFYLGLILLIVGITEFCPLCYFFKKCNIKR